RDDNRSVMRAECVQPRGERGEQVRRHRRGRRGGACPDDGRLLQGHDVWFLGDDLIGDGGCPRGGLRRRNLVVGLCHRCCEGRGRTRRQQRGIVCALVHVLRHDDEWDSI